MLSERKADALLYPKRRGLRPRPWPLCLLSTNEQVLPHCRALIPAPFCARVSFAPLLAWHSDVPEQCRSAESFLSTSRWRRPLPRTNKSQTRFFNQHHTGAATADNRQDRRREQRDCASHQRAALASTADTTPARATHAHKDVRVHLSQLYSRSGASTPLAPPQNIKTQK